MYAELAPDLPKTRLRLLLGLVAFFLAISTSSAIGVCPEWRAGPFTGGVTSPNGPINASIVWDPDGAGPRQELLIVGGEFTSIGGVQVSNVASWDGTVWRDLAGGVDGPIRALAIHEGILVAAGSFTSAGGVQARFVARYNDLYWSPMGNGMLGGSSVYALATYNGQLYAGGNFNNNTRRWDAPSSTWVSFGSSLDGPVYALAAYGSYLYAGGDFQNGGLESMPFLAKWSGSSWSSVADGDGGLDDDVYALHVYNGMLAVGGAFAHIDNQGVPQKWCILWDGTRWLTMDCGNPCSLGAPVYSLTSYDGYLHAGGEFHAGGTTAMIRRVARWDVSGWQALGGGIGAGVANGEAVYTMAEYRGELFAGGTFNIPVRNLARWNGTSWNDSSAPVSVNALAVYGNRVGLAGSFSQYFPEGESSHIAAWDGQQLLPLETGTNAPVMALTGYTITSPPQRNVLVVGGQFTTAGGVSAMRVAQWTESDDILLTGWSALGDGFNGDVLALGRFAGTTVAGGGFTRSGPNPLLHVARWNGSVWEAMGTGINGAVFSLKGYSLNATTSVMLAGGLFTSANGTSALCIASWIDRLDLPDTPWSPLGSGLNGAVYAIERHSGSTYAGGAFAASGSGTPLNHVARFSGGDWVAVGTGLPGTVFALKSEGGFLYATGDFPGSVARFEDGAWVIVDGGVDATARAVAAYHGELFVGGDFTSVGSVNIPTLGAARFLTTGVPWIAVHPFPQTVGEGENASFSVYPANGYWDLAFSWRRNGIPLEDGATGHGSTIFGAATRDLTIQQVAAADSGAYDCVVSNPCGSETSYAAILTVTMPSGVAEALPVGGTFLSVFPNPARGAAAIVLDLPAEGRVDAGIYDVSGRKVRDLMGGVLLAGRHQFAWDGRDQAGRALVAGVYFVRVDAPQFNTSKPVVWIR